MFCLLTEDRYEGIFMEFLHEKHHDTKIFWFECNRDFYYLSVDEIAEISDTERRFI